MLGGGKIDPLRRMLRRDFAWGLMSAKDLPLNLIQAVQKARVSRRASAGRESWRFKVLLRPRTD
jgi:hypothetical protein